MVRIWKSFFGKGYEVYGIIWLLRTISTCRKSTVMPDPYSSQRNVHPIRRSGVEAAISRISHAIFLPRMINTRLPGWTELGTT